MTDLFQTGSIWLEEQRHQYMTRTVLYVRGTSTVDVQATIGRTVFEQADEFDIVTKTESRDYLIRTADLVINRQPTLPKRGDQIRETDGSSTFVYEVLSPGDEPVFRYSDPYRKVRRIHTKHSIRKSPNPAEPGKPPSATSCTPCASPRRTRKV